METIRLKQRDTYKRYPIADMITGEPTGEYIEIDTEDTTNALRWQEAVEEHKKNSQWLKMQTVVIEKKEDKKGKKVLSSKEEDKFKLMDEYYKKEMDAIDKFLGKDGCKKLLNGKNPYYSMFDDIAEVIEVIMPDLKEGIKSVEKRIKEKYSQKKEGMTIE